MTALELIVALQIVVAILVYLARRILVPYPILLVLGGLTLAAIPGLPHVELEPEVVLLLFLPPILFFAGYLTPYRDFKANTRPILLLAIGLVLFTATIVAVVVNAAVPEMGFAAAFALGAIVAPPDAIAATAIFRNLGAPRRVITILEGESLLNDATALVAYRTAVGVALGMPFLLQSALASFVVVVVAGIVIGLIVGVVGSWLFEKMDDPPVEVAISLILPFLAYLPAERLGVSGVLAAVTAGLYLGRQSPRVLSSETRLLGEHAWQIVIFSLEGFAFILIGLQLPQILEAISARDPAQLVGLAVLISVTVIVARILWVYPATYLPRLIPSIRAADPPPPWKVPFVVGWSGMRGAVSLAAALALPARLPGARPDRVPRLRRDPRHAGGPGTDAAAGPAVGRRRRGRRQGRPRGDHRPPGGLGGSPRRDQRAARALAGAPAARRAARGDVQPSDGAPAGSARGALG